ncbi:hypothetical protein CLF_112761 [Clonorchis sinensis]|uniref:Peptidase aspartic putative domain-containing protein n=1 Tax=Clonorchis sinensis TaxID=79923 RepID=H2KVN2_CLOSI|nr:hypothetical protein CLF_112761 [Clonorchis sinensis]
MATATLGGPMECTSESIDIRLLSMDEIQSIGIDRAFVVDNIPMRAVPSIRELAGSWPHLDDIPFDELTEDEVGILLVSEVSEAHLVFYRRLGDKKQPVALKTLVGWILLCPMPIKATQKAVSRCMAGYSQDVQDSLQRLHNAENTDTSAYNLAPP